MPELQVRSSSRVTMSRRQYTVLKFSLLFTFAIILMVSAERLYSANMNTPSDRLSRDATISSSTPVKDESATSELATSEPAATSELATSEPAATSELATSESAPDFRTQAKNASRSLQLPPFHNRVRPVEEILEAQWVTELWTYLSHLDNKYVSLCIGNSAYMESVVNWLIAALVVVQPPLENVLVISLDVELHELLHEHGINSVYVNQSTLLVKEQTAIWVTRLIMFRLISHWGYTLATYDSDAIPVKNPQLLFAKFGDSDLVGSSGTHPTGIYKIWRSSTVCMGVLLIRASERTGIMITFLPIL